LLPKHVVLCWCFLLLLPCVQLNGGAEPGFLEGHLKIFSLKEVEIAEAGPSKGQSTDYVDYPLIVLSKDGKSEVARVIADDKGNYRVRLPPGDYILDMEGHLHGHVRAKPQPFTITSSQAVHVDMNIDTGIR
jgi:hypothetical protein